MVVPSRLAIFLLQPVLPKGAVIPGTGLSVDASGNLNHSNTATAGTFTKVTIDAQGHVTTGATLLPLTFLILRLQRLQAARFQQIALLQMLLLQPSLADSSVTKFGGAGATDNIVTFPDGDFKGQFFFDEKNEDLYIYTGNRFCRSRLSAAT